MKFYKTNYTENGEQKNVWCSTQVDANRIRVDLKRAGNKTAEVVTVDVPTSKEELLKWLNENQR